MTDMTENRVANLEGASAPESVSCSISGYPASSETRSRQRNVFHLLAQREVLDRTKHQAKKHSTKSLRCEPWRDLLSWVESQSLHCWSAKYCPLVPTPRSTIAAAFSPDGRTLASTHGDHTIKIIDYQTGKCLRELLGHQRTPWVVRYHPVYPDIIASGSLDQEVRLWDAKTSHCIGAHNFNRPIASIAFHANGELLAIAAGHKLYIWDHSKRGEASHPRVILKTRRSLRAVHFHPCGAAYLLTAEVKNLDFGDSTLTPATSSGYSNCHPAVIVANSSSMCCPHLKSRLSSPCLLWPAHLRDDEIICPLCNDQGVYSTNVQPTLSSLDQNSPLDTENQEISHIATPMDVYPGESRVSNDDNSASAPLYAQTESNAVRVQLDPRVHSASFGASSQHSTSLHHLTASIPTRSQRAASVPGVETFLGTQPGVHGVSLTLGSEVPSSLFDCSGAELPCTVKLKIWLHNVKYPYATLDPGACCLTVSHAVLCSEMGTHFSPCGRFLVACVACQLPQRERDHGTQLPVQYDSAGAGTSPTRHPLSLHQVIYELRVYSLEKATFGKILGSRAIRAAHCLTSIQFSPTSEHILLAYGRRHNSLLRTIFFDGSSVVPVYTVLEVYRVSDMELVRVLPSALDEVNVACFHPSPGAGLVYGTKEGKLRILQLNGANSGPDFFSEQNILERNVL